MRAAAKPVTVAMKTCIKCHNVQPESDFVACRNNIDGLRGDCRVCNRAYATAYRAKNAQHVRDLNKAYRLAHPDRVRAQVSKWQAQNADRLKATIRAWSKRNAHRIRAYAQNYRANMRAAGFIAAFEIKRLFEDFPRCVYCLDPATSIDHVEPLSKGGSHSLENIVPACGSCNSSKRNIPLIVWLTRIRPDDGRSSARKDPST